MSQLTKWWGAARRPRPSTAPRPTAAPRPAANAQPERCDFTPDELAIAVRVREFTMTSTERIVAAIRATEYVARHRIPGSIVECGVWRGGSMMAMALTLLSHNFADVPLYLFDTFKGMSQPTNADGAVASDEWSKQQTPTHNEWCYASQNDVARNLASTGYEPSRIHFCAGKVEETLPAQAPDQIALLRLDTDWYESTRHELVHLFPRLVRGGVLIIDDYGHWPGCRQAVDEYFAEHNIAILLQRIDYTGRIAVKC